MKSREELSRILLEIPKSQHKRLKATAALRGTSMRAIIMEALEAMDICARSSHIPNKETKKSIKNIEERKNLTKHESVEALFKKFRL